MDIKTLLASGDSRIHLERSGMVTRCRIACEAQAAGRTSVILARTREEFHAARALTTLFAPELSLGDVSLSMPSWQSPCLFLPELIDWRDTARWASLLAVFHALALPGAHCLVVSAQSLLLRYMPRDFFASRSLDLARGSDWSPDLLLEQASEWGYRRVPMVVRPGEMARRGDILDIFPSGYARPLRLEFFGDTLEDMRFFDAESQRSLLDCAEFTLLPVSPLALDASALDAARHRCNDMLSQGRISENDCYSFKKSLDAGGEGLLPGCVLENPSLLEDWLPADSLWLLPGEADSGDALLQERLLLKERLRWKLLCRSPRPWPCANVLCPRPGTAFSASTPSRWWWGWNNAGYAWPRGPCIPLPTFFRSQALLTAPGSTFPLLSRSGGAGGVRWC